MTRSLTPWILAGIVAGASIGCSKKEAPPSEVGANLGLSASTTPPSPVGHEATHIQQQKPTSGAQVGGNKSETIGGSKSIGVSNSGK